MSLITTDNIIVYLFLDNLKSINYKKRNIYDHKYNINPGALNDLFNKE